jgi:hypothetical protein
VPVVLAPGDVFVNADFGYVFPTGSDLGDLIYFDANADGVFNAADGDYGIEDVTVVLLDGGGHVIASAITDPDRAVSVHRPAGGDLHGVGQRFRQRLDGGCRPAIRTAFSTPQHRRGGRRERRSGRRTSALLRRGMRRGWG